MSGIGLGTHIIVAPTPMVEQAAMTLERMTEAAQHLASDLDGTMGRLCSDSRHRNASHTLDMMCNAYETYMEGKPSVDPGPPTPLSRS